MPELSPLLVLAVGTATVVALIVAFRVNAFLALISAALLVSLVSPGPLPERVSRVAVAFGSTAGSIGIVIALAAVIGRCMMDSGAADRVVRLFLDLLGKERGGAALLGSGFVLGVPVFFDTVFYLLVPLARSMYRRTGGGYLKYVMAISAGACVTHTLVPPTPGPLVIASNLGVDLGVLIPVGLVVALPSAVAGLTFASWLDRRRPVFPGGGVAGATAAPDQPSEQPGVLLSLLPILLPVVLISSATVAETIAAGQPAGSGWASLADVTAVVGNPNLALFLSAAIAMWTLMRQRRLGRQGVAEVVEAALASGGLIILITSAGGAFGAMLQAAGIGPTIQQAFSGSGQAAGALALFVAFAVASLLKVAQGSSTVAMIATSAMLASLARPEVLGCHPVYLATTIGSGSLVGSWMNDSGFWIYAKMGEVSELDTLRSWSPLLALLGITGFLTTLLLSRLVPLA